MLPVRHLEEFGRCRFQLAIVLAAAALALGGCDDESAFVVSAVQPYYTTQDLTTDGALPGAWRLEDEDVTFTFTPAEGNAYNVTVDDKEQDKNFSSRFEGHLFRLGADSFLDLYPNSVPPGSEFYLLHFFPCHTVARIDFRGDQLEMSFVSPRWLATQIKAGAVNIAHTNSDEILLLTATTQEMQELLNLNASDDNAFGEPLVFERAQEEDQ
ncbi:MAG TPA: hypothetical protein VMJ35_05920 [Dongiaceae bacterium]|nr:hypothetical protein [Dongiaceae bacterium]